MFISDFERSMLKMMAEGQPDSAIASRLCMGDRVFQGHLADLMTRLGTHTRMALGATAAREKLVDLPERLRGARDRKRSSAPAEH